MACIDSLSSSIALGSYVCICVSTGLPIRSLVIFRNSEATVFEVPNLVLSVGHFFTLP